MCPQSADIRGCIVTLVTFLWFNDIVICFLQDCLICILQTKVIIFKILLHCQCVLCFVQMVASNWVKFIICFWSPIISIVFHDILSLFHYWMAHVLVVSNTCECIYLLLMWDMIAKKRRPFYYDRKPPLRCSRHPAIKKTEQFHNSEWFNQTDIFLITSTSNIEILFVDKPSRTSIFQPYI